MAHRQNPVAQKTSVKHGKALNLPTNLEAFACLWLDSNVKKTEDNRQTEKALRQIINHLRIFDNVHECEKLIRQTKHEKVILIVSGQLAREIIPRTHGLVQLVACYIYCFNASDHEEWAKDYSKIRGVYQERAEFLKDIGHDQTARHRAEELSAIEVVGGDSKELQARDAMFMWFQLFMEVLMRMHYSINSKQEFIDICKTNYKGNSKELSFIEQFQENYTADNAIYWYTCECCFYRILNKALRIQNFNMLFILRFFITDISRQLKLLRDSTLNLNSNIIVYRGQAVPRDEIHLMETCVGKYLSMNSFFSTSLDKNVAMKFLKDADIAGGLERILFEITINPLDKTKSYANVSELSYYKTEAEVLIMLGAIFRIDSIEEKPSDHMWVAHLALASEDDYQLKKTLDYMKQKIGEETNLGTLSEILIEMGEYKQALQYSNIIMREAQMNMAKAYEIEAKVASLQGDYKTSLERSAHIMKIYEQVLPMVCAEKGQLYCAIGAVYHQQKLYDQALSNLNKALDIQNKVLPANHVDVAQTYQHLADCYESKKMMDKALEYYQKCLCIQLNILPETHPSIALTYNNMGSFYDTNEKYEKALEFYQKSLNISSKSLPPNHPEVERTKDNIENVKLKLKS